MTWRQRILYLGVATFMVVVFYRLSEAVVAPPPDRKVVVDVPANACPQRLHPESVKCEVNAIRRANDLPPLRTNLKLRRAARAHARDMVNRRYFAHASPEGVNVSQRVRQAGYLRGARAWSVGENIGWGTGEAARPEAVVEAWMHSPPHRAIILSTRYSEGGAGIVPGTPTGEPGGATYVMDVGRRRSPRTGRISGWEEGIK